MAEKPTVREYAIKRKMQPQLLYYYIRTGKVKVKDCDCGRKIIDVESADKFLAAKAAKKK